MSKGLAVIYDPHNLFQFIWYYSTYGSDKKWDALCLPNGFKGQYMDQYCKKCGIFENIFTDDKDFITVSMKEQVKIFFKMFGYALIGRQRRFCNNFLKKYVDIEKYDEINVMTDVGLVSGLCIGLGKTKKVVIMEDGISDYVSRSYRNVFGQFFKMHTWKGFLLSLMGYSNVGHVFPLRTTKRCIKFSSHFEIMHYKKYASHHKLYDYSKTDMSLFETIVSKIYGDISAYDFDSYDAVFFSEPLSDFFADTDHYRQLIENYISSCSSAVLVKKHPRDKLDYSFSDSVKSDVFDQSIPAEVMLPYLRNKRMFFMPYSSIMLYLDSDTNEIHSMFLKEASNADQSGSILGHYPSKDKVTDTLKKYGIDNYTLAEL